MSNENLKVRVTALVKALQWAEGKNIGAETILAVAEKFRVFLTKETESRPTIKVAKPELPTLKLPRVWDGFEYFQFEDTPILYRAELSYGAEAGGVSRLNCRVDTGWSDQVGESVGTRYSLRNRLGYDSIGPAKAADIIKKHVKGARFE